MNFDFVGLGVALIGVIVWFVRQEGRINHCDAIINRIQKELDQLIIKHENLDSRVLEELSQVRESLARIEGQLIGEKKIKERK